LILVPSIDLDNGLAVKWVAGRPGTGLVLGDPVRLAEELWSLGFRKLHVVDLSGARRGRITGAALSVARSLSRIGFDLRLGGGIRSLRDALAACNSGAEEILIGTLWVRDPRAAKAVIEAVSGCNAVAAVDAYRGGFLRIMGWTRQAGIRVEEAIRLARGLGFKGVLYTRIDREGLMSGVDASDVERVRRLSAGMVLSYAGGIASPRDLEVLASLGVDEAVVGMALYTGSLPLEVAAGYARG